MRTLSNITPSPDGQIQPECDVSQCVRTAHGSDDLGDLMFPLTPQSQTPFDFWKKRLAPFTWNAAGVHGSAWMAAAVAYVQVQVDMRYMSKCLSLVQTELLLQMTVWSLRLSFPRHSDESCLPTHHVLLASPVDFTLRWHHAQKIAFPGYSNILQTFYMASKLL